MPDKTKRPEADKAKHQYTTLLPETIAMIQMKIVDLEIQIRLKEDECDFLNEVITVARADLKKNALRTYEIRELNKKIEETTKQLESAEVECDRLERTQLYYKQQLDSGSTLPVY